MFADVANLCYVEENIKTFNTINIELQKNSQWFISNKLSLKKQTKKNQKKQNKNKILIFS